MAKFERLGPSHFGFLSDPPSHVDSMSTARDCEDVIVRHLESLTV